MLALSLPFINPHIIMKVLLVDRHQPRLTKIKAHFEAQNFLVTTATDGQQVIELTQTDSFDVVILSLSLPIKSGYEVIVALRCLKQNVPILALSELGTVKDCVLTLNLGADDFLPQDCCVEELAARAKRLIRRTDGEAKNLLYYKTLTLDLSNMTVRRNQQLIQLTKKEFIILLELLRKKRRVVSTQDLIAAAWGPDESTTLSNKLNVHMRTLRQKVDRPFRRPLIQTVRGFGYKLSV